MLLVQALEQVSWFGQATVASMEIDLATAGSHILNQFQIKEISIVCLPWLAKNITIG